MNLTSPELDEYFKNTQTEILQCFDTFKQVENLIEQLSNTIVTKINVGNILDLPCLGTYLQKQQNLFANVPFDFIKSRSDIFMFINNFFGLINNKQRFDELSVTPQCSIQVFEANYTTPYQHYVIYDTKYKTLQFVPNNLYCAVSGQNVDMFINKTKVLTFNTREFVFVENKSEVYFESNSPFEIQLYPISKIGDYQQINNLPNRMIDLTFESYVQLPAYIWFDNPSEKIIVFPNQNNVYSVRLFIPASGIMNIMHITTTATDTEKLSANIFRNIAWI